MYNRIFQLICVIIIIASMVQAQGKRWRLKFEHTAPEMITIIEPDGMKKNYWYFRYKLTNDTDRDIKECHLQIRLVIDKNAPGVLERDVPNIFYQAQFPEGVNKSQYLKNLQTFYDTDLPLVKQEILTRLGIYPKLSIEEKKVLSLLEDKTPKSPMDLMKKAKMSYQELRTILDGLVIKNLAIPEEVQGSSTFIEGKNGNAIFLIYNQENTIRMGETINGWQIISCTENRVTLKKNNILNTLSQGMLVESSYTKSGKIQFERDPYLVSAANVRGVYKGKLLGSGEKKYDFKGHVIPKNSAQEGIAIFASVPVRTDFMAIVVNGLVDPIVGRKGKLFIEEEVWMAGYQCINHILEKKIVPLYQRWEILSSREKF